MAYDTLVNKTILENGLTNIAYAIRNLSAQGLGKLSFPGGMTSALEDMTFAFDVSASTMTSLANKLSGKKCKFKWKFCYVDGDGAVYVDEYVHEDATYLFALTESGVALWDDIENSYGDTIEESREQDDGWGWGHTQCSPGDWWVLDGSFVVLNEGEKVLLVGVVIET